MFCSHIGTYLRKFGKFTVPDFYWSYSNTARTVCHYLCVSCFAYAGQTWGRIVFSKFLEVVSIQLLLSNDYLVDGDLLAKWFIYSSLFLFLNPVGNPSPIGNGRKVLGSDTYLLSKINGLSRSWILSCYLSGTKSMIKSIFITLMVVLDYHTCCFYLLLKSKRRMKISWICIGFIIHHSSLNCLLL
jgi:cation/acetate symporter